MAKILNSLFTLLLIFSTSNCAKILGVFHVPGPSHYLAGSTLMKILAGNGHDVTMVSAFSSKKNVPENFKEVVITGVYEELLKNQPNFFDLSLPMLLAPLIFTFVSASMIESTLNHTNFKNLMNSGEKFDVVIIEQFQSEAMKYIAHHFNAPLIVYNALDANEWVNPYQGNPDSPAYTPNLYSSKPASQMTFLERTLNAVQYVYSNIFTSLVTLPYQNRLLHKYYPDAPHISDLSYNVSLVLLNSDLSVYEALPRVPSMVNIGGFHIEKPEPLPEDLQSLIDNAKNGVIYFSLGSNLKSKDMPKAKRDLISRTFSKLKQTVIWKFEEDFPDKPDNVVIRKWLPQNDILAHKNVKLFITHGGIFSSMEAVYHSIPILALPVLDEQVANARRAENNGYAKVIPFSELKEETFSTYLRELLENPEYGKNVQERSKIMKDKPITPREAINYWVEYVIRHKGAPHLKVAALKLAWYQYLLLDVVFFIILSLCTFIWCMKLLMRVLVTKKKEKIH